MSSTIFAFKCTWYLVYSDWSDRDSCFIYVICYLYLLVRNTCVYPRWLMKFILLCLLSCDVISIIVFVFLFFFFRPLCVSFELLLLITHLHLHNFIAKWTPPKQKWKKKIISNLLFQIKITFNWGNNSSDKTLPTYPIEGPSWSSSYSSWIYNYPCNIGDYDYKFRSWRGVLDTTVCDKVCQWLAAARWFSLGTPPDSAINKADRRDI